MPAAVAAPQAPGGDWLAGLEAAGTGALIPVPGAAAAPNPFLAAAAAAPAAPTTRTALAPAASIAAAAAAAPPKKVAVKENIRPGTSGRRRRRQLPDVGSFAANTAPAAGRLRKSASLSFLPSSTSSSGDRIQGRPRRRLPDTEQGKLIKEVADKLEEEAKARLEVARELKDEKRKLWKVEDELNEAKIEASALRKQLQEKRRENERLTAELGEERAVRHTTEHAVETLGRELRISKASVAKMRDASEAAAAEVQSGEDALQEAFEQVYEEKRRRQMAEEKMSHVTQQILAIPGGSDILKRLLPGGGGSGDADRALSPGGTGMVLGASPSPRMLSPEMLSPHVMPVTNL